MAETPDAWREQGQGSGDEEERRDTIACPECGEPARLLTQVVDDESTGRTVGSYRCTGCGDRWDVIIDEPE